MNITIGICDDQQHYVSLIRQFLSEFYQEEEDIHILSSTDPLAFMDILESNQIDLLFLDIDMGSISGIDIANRAHLLYDNPVIIFITAFQQYAVEAFNIRAFHYLLKPITQEKFNQVMIEVIKYFSQINDRVKPKNIIVKTNSEIITIDCRDIFYFEKIGHKIKICSKSEDIFFYSNFTNLLHEIDDQLFIRCHQGFVVNIEKVTSFRNKILYLMNNHELPVSRSYNKVVKDMLSIKLFQ